MFEKLKKRWEVHSNFQVVVILFVFSITGFSSLFVAKPILEAIGLSQETTNSWIYRPIRLLLIFPFYQVLILCYGWIFGQYDFFKKFVTKFLSRIGFKWLFKS